MKTNRIALLAAVLCAGFGLQAVADEPAAGHEDLFQKLDQNADGKLTSDEVGEEQARFFERLVRVGDRDDNKVLTKDEFLGALKGDDGPVAGGFGFGGPSGGRDGRPRMDPKQAFERLDANNDGKLSLDEMPQPMRERLQPLLDRLGRAELTAEDLARLQRLRDGRPEAGARPDGRPRPEGKAGKNVGRRFGRRRAGGPEGGDGPRRPGPPSLPRFFEKLDSNGDHRLSKEELSKAAELFGELDEDGNGQLEPRELLGPRPGDDGGPRGFGPGPFRPGRPGPPDRPGRDRPPRDDNAA